MVAVSVMPSCSLVVEDGCCVDVKQLNVARELTCFRCCMPIWQLLDFLGV